MKLIHTSDWHLGHVLYAYNRDKEQEAMLRQIEQLVREETPDVLVVSGDIYHSGQPSAAVQRLFTEAIMRIRQACPSMEMIITAGNHDSAARHEISRVLWGTQRVHMIGSVDKDRLDRQIVAIPGKGYVIAVPYLNERSIPEGFWQSLLDAVAGKNEAGLPVVLMAHLTVRGSDFQGHDDALDYSVGGIDSVELDQLGAGYDYLALGHIHRAQTLSGSQGRARYSGTPLPVSFDETYAHSVSVVELASHGSIPRIREVEIRNPYPLVNLPSGRFAAWEEVKQLSLAFPRDLPAYIRLNVEVEDTLPPEAQAEIRAIFSEGKGRLCQINTRRKRDVTSQRKTLSVSEFRAMEPIAVARLYAADSGLEFDEEAARLFREAEGAVREDQRNQ